MNVHRPLENRIWRFCVHRVENAVNDLVSTGTEDGTATLTVEDDGPGIPPELGERVFDRFIRGAGTGTRGSGLGLAIVRAVAESHGGSVTLEQPDAGNGTRFVIRIPRSAGAPTPTPAVVGNTRRRARK